MNAKTTNPPAPRTKASRTPSAATKPPSSAARLATHLARAGEPAKIAPKRKAKPSRQDIDAEITASFSATEKQACVNVLRDVRDMQDAIRVSALRAMTYGGGIGRPIQSVAACVRVFDALMPYQSIRRRDGSGTTLLMAAARLADPYNKQKNAVALHMIAALLPGSDPLAQSSTGHTALMVATSSPQAVDLLLPVSDALAINAKGETALMIAALSGSAAAVEKLLPQSDPDAVDRESKTALRRAVARLTHWGAAGAAIPMLAERTSVSIAEALNEALAHWKDMAEEGLAPELVGCAPALDALASHRKISARGARRAIANKDPALFPRTAAKLRALEAKALARVVNQSRKAVEEQRLAGMDSLRGDPSSAAANFELATPARRGAKRL